METWKEARYICFTAVKFSVQKNSPCRGVHLIFENDGKMENAIQKRQSSTKISRQLDRCVHAKS